MGIFLGTPPPPVSSFIVEKYAQPETPDYFCLAASPGSEMSVSLSAKFKQKPDIYFEYSYDKSNWQDWTTLSAGKRWKDLPLNDNQPSVYIRACLSGNTRIFPRQFAFSGNGEISASGNIMSLLDQTCESTTLLSAQTFKELFGRLGQGSNQLVAAGIKLPATNLAAECYSSMFSACLNLETGPSVLPAADLCSSCYSNMFHNCRKLKNTPILSATSTAPKCCYWMFTDCEAITTAPVLLPAQMSNSCYDAMFGACLSLSAPPELPATVLANSCYSHMFQQCYSLTATPYLPATALLQGCYYEMFLSSNITSVTLPITGVETKDQIELSGNNMFGYNRSDTPLVRMLSCLDNTYQLTITYNPDTHETTYVWDPDPLA